MPTFLTVKEAARLTGKSPSSIRRVIYPILQDDQHPDRRHIEPSADEVVKLRLKGENFAWRLSEELLRREVPIEEAAEKPRSGSSRVDTASESGELLSMLRRELEIKNQQIAQQSEVIAKQMEVINGLGERLREGNILIGSLQKHLALTDGRDQAVSDAAKPRGESRPKEKAPKTAPKPKPKPGLFGRWFR